MDHQLLNSWWLETCDLTGELTTSNPSISNSESGEADQEFPVHEDGNVDSLEYQNSFKHSAFVFDTIYSKWQGSTKLC